ncbi:hypothetical protein Dsin_023452 [Dipteronia sinensis]|uniref:non-specific serine/threonine protein kinase n=1 Tax=Dipteronia sinensis TaxID=43782 RepID=A0AAE0E241_9ROSI|nr:hypothetical protein Dsin_023452 [Dipteronia sinensis]
MGNSSSTPSCTITYREKHDVFLSFRGQDTRQGFTSHLYAGLRRKQIKTFIDYELERGDEISPVLLKAIEESKISVIIFSNDYASSKWCLDELVKILECKKMNGQIVIPVFYHVDPSDVRKQTKSFGDAFVKHEQDFGKDNDKKLKVKRWRTALTDASNLSGWDSSTARSEYELVEQIVKDILKKSRCSKKRNNLKKSNVRSVSGDFRHLVGIDSRINCVKSLLFIGKLDFKIIGIWGMGGLGKTTIAKGVFDQISSEFGACHFFANVRQESEIPNGLVHLREKVLSKILDEEYVVGTIDISEYIKDKLRRRKVLIVLDDVDNVDQIKILSEGIDQFGPGSRIIITTRNKQVLRNYSVNDIYDIKAFDDRESLQLFCIHAFKQDHPPNNYKEFAKVLENGVGTASAKVRDGASSLAKTSGSAKISDRAGFVESGEISTCRGSTSSDSTSSDVSDESTCSSFSSSVNKPHKANDARWVAIQAVRSKDGLLGVGHFRLLRKLGCGDIGSVYLSESSGTKCYFAMKVMDKVSLSKRKKLLRAQTEREILQSLDHPFLPTLYTHFETDKFSCLVMEFCPGGDLHILRQRQPGKHFSEQAVKFYIAEVLLAMEYLHMLGIVYRDLKPENVLVREDGHIMLSDFDLSLRCAVSPTVVKSSSNESESLQKKSGLLCSICLHSALVYPAIMYSPYNLFWP